MKKYNLGFTLVELLIVIGLLGAIALIVISAINPLEQANRARDTRFKADSSQIVSASDRYFAAKSEFPWVTAGITTTNDAAFGFVNANTVGVGICGATCSVDGYIINANELKTEFRNRDFITATTIDKQVFVGKGQGASASVYVCFIPVSKSNRDKSCASGKVYTLSTTNGTRTAVPVTTCSPSTADWTNPGWYICVPE